MEIIAGCVLPIMAGFVLADGCGALRKPSGSAARGKEIRMVSAGDILTFCGAAALLMGLSTGHTVFYFLACLMTLLVITMHGALRFAMVASGKGQSRARVVASTMYWMVCAAVLVSGIAGFGPIGAAFTQASWMWVFPLLAATGLFGLRLCISTRLDLWAFLSSSVFIAGLLCTTAVALFPGTLPG